MSISDLHAQTIERLDLAEVPSGRVSRYLLEIVRDGMGMPVYVPILVAKGRQDGSVLGLTAAVHGNELNGIPVIQRLFSEVDVSQLRGTIVGVPVFNVPSYLDKKRRFIDNVDLNHIMPGREDGNVSQVYAWKLIDKLIKRFDFLVDLHTASNGRINSYYVRADLADDTVRKMAMLQNSQIVVHNPPNDGTLRGAADEMGIPAITLEVGNPNLFQNGMIRSSLTGIHNLLGAFGFTNVAVKQAAHSPLICEHSYWIYTDVGGLLTVLPQVAQTVNHGEPIALVRNIFGDIIREYRAPQAGIVIGKSVSPVNQEGGRILHLGIEYAQKAKNMTLKSSKFPSRN